MKRVLILSAVLGVLAAAGCGGGGGGEIQTKNAVYSGGLSISQGGSNSTAPIDLVLTSSQDPVSGTIFRKTDGVVLTVGGTRSSLSVTAPGERYNGTLTLATNAATLSLTGTDAHGPLTATASLSRSQYINIAGTYDVAEELTLTITIDGQSQTQTNSGAGRIALQQDGANIRYTVPGTNVARTGSISGNTLTMSGPFGMAADGVRYTKNNITFVVDITDQNHFTSVGHGEAAGTYNGYPFAMVGTDTATLDRVQSGAPSRAAAATATGSVAGPHAVGLAIGAGGKR
jgi:hypothetical protein